MVDLVISGIDFPPFAIRGVQQSLEPIEGSAQMERTVNGKLLDMSTPEFRKYQSSITGSDFQTPSFAFPGTLVTVDSVKELSFRTVGGVQQRTEVPGSLRVEGYFTFYRPRLAMRVRSFSSQLDEMEAIVSWSLVLEED